MTDQAPELLPCPFCDMPPCARKGPIQRDLARIACQSYNCIGPHTTAESYDDAVVQWNTRPTPSEPVAQADYTAWLIETDEGASINYFQMVDDDDWTFDQNKAMHFGRKHDAEKVIEYYGWTRARAVEHMWPSLVERPVAQVREALDACREFLVGMTTPAKVGPFVGSISSYHPCHALIAKIDAALTSERPSESAVAREPVKKYADTFSAVSVIKEMFFPHARSDRETIAEAIYFSQRGRLVDQGGVTAQRPWRDNSIPDTFWNHFLADADAVLALAIPREAAAWTEEERHAIAHARHQVEQASPENPDCCFDFDLVKDLLRVIDRSIPHGDAVRALDRDGAAQAAAAIFDYADMNVTKFDAYGDGEVPAGATEIYEAAKKLRDLLSPTLASERVQATSVASATACDHLTTEQVWRPIETAPKDGTRILGCDGSTVEVIYWADGWFNQSCEMSTWRAFPPTHWMPLPAPPAGQVIANPENLLGSEPEPTLASERVSERETMTSVPADRVIGELPSEQVWAPISELPETDPSFLGKGVQLLLFSQQFGIRTGEAFNAHGRKWANVGNLHGNAIDDWGATHWMYLPPEPPDDSLVLKKDERSEPVSSPRVSERTGDKQI